MRTSTSERSGRQGEFTPPAVRRIGPTARPFPTAAPSRGRVVALALLTLLATATAATSPLTAQTETEGIEASAPTDEAIRDALVRRLRAVEGLDGIEVAVEAGVVRLTGEVLSPTLREEAVSLAEATEGTVRVVDEVELIRDPREVLGPVLEELTDRARTFLAWLPLLGVALVIVLLFTLLAAWAGRRDWPYSKLSTNRFVQDLLRQVARSILFLTGALIALELLDATALVGAVLGAAGVAGLAIGFAFRNVVENFIASALLSVRQPFLPNDHVVIDGHEGKVLRLTSRATVLLTLDGNHLRIPNATVFNAVLLNYTRNPRRRLEVVVGIGTDEDLVFAQRLGVETLSEIDGVLADPPPTSRITELADSSVVVTYFAWVDQRENDFEAVRSEAKRLVKTALESAGLDLPEPIYRLRIARSDAPPQPPRPARDEPAPAAETPTPVDTTIDAQIQVERETSEDDLLSYDAPLE